MDKQKLQIDQLESKIKVYAPLVKIITPPTGWTRAIRLSLGMSLQQLAERLGTTKQSVQEMEKRESNETISIRTLRKTAEALDMKLVYGFVPKDGSLEALIERKARELAIKIVARTSNTMKLEGQENSEERLKKAVAERAAVIKSEMPKILWD